jgi:hypothetical protein
VIEQTDQRVREWLRAIDPDADLSLAPPGDDRPGLGVGLYLLGMAKRPAGRGSERPPLQVWLRYLVTAWAEEPERAQQLLLEICFAAMEDAEMEVDLEPTPPELWLALGARPRPAFVLRAPARRERPVVAAPLVRWPLRIEPGRPSTLIGLVVGPGDVPIADASVEIPALQRETHTDPRGRFRFRGLPGPPVSTALVVRAKGREVSLTVSGADPSQPVVVHVDPMEKGYAGLPDA